MITAPHQNQQGPPHSLMILLPDLLKWYTNTKQGLLKKTVLLKFFFNYFFILIIGQLGTGKTCFCQM